MIPLQTTKTLKSGSYKPGCKCYFCSKERGEHVPTAEFNAKSAALHSSSSA